MQLAGEHSDILFQRKIGNLMLCQRMCYNYTYFIARQTELPKNHLNQHARDIILWWCQVSHLMALLNTGEVFANKTVCDVSWNGSTLSFGNHLTAISLHVPAHTSTTPIHYTMPCSTHTSLVHVLGLLFSHDYTPLLHPYPHSLCSYTSFAQHSTQNSGLLLYIT